MTRCRWARVLLLLAEGLVTHRHAPSHHASSPHAPSRVVAGVPVLLLFFVGGARHAPSRVVIGGCDSSPLPRWRRSSRDVTCRCWRLRILSSSSLDVLVTCRHVSSHHASSRHALSHHEPSRAVPSRVVTLHRWTPVLFLFLAGGARSSFIGELPTVLEPLSLTMSNSSSVT